MSRIAKHGWKHYPVERSANEHFLQAAQFYIMLIMRNNLLIDNDILYMSLAARFPESTPRMLTFSRYFVFAIGEFMLPVG